MVTPAKRVIELTKGNRSILVAIYGTGDVSTCVKDEIKNYCETCKCNEEICEDWLSQLKSQGYSATEIKLGELELEESLPKFLEEREGADKIEPVVETEEIEHADTEAVEAIPGSPGELQPGESGGSSPETS